MEPVIKAEACAAAASGARAEQGLLAAQNPLAWFPGREVGAKRESEETEPSDSDSAPVQATEEVAAARRAHAQLPPMLPPPAGLLASLASGPPASRKKPAAVQDVTTAPADGGTASSVKRQRSCKAAAPSPAPARLEEAMVAQRLAAGQPSSSYVGVSWETRARKWSVQIYGGNKNTKRLRGPFESEEVAARAYDAEARRLRDDLAHGHRTNRLNFPTEDEAKVAAAPVQLNEAQRQADEAMVAQRLAAGQPSSSYVGVRWNKTARKWNVHIYGEYDGKKKTKRLRGPFESEEVAARAYDAESRWLRGNLAHGHKKNRLNFPTEDEAKVAAAPARAPVLEDEAVVAQRFAAGQQSSRCVGVSWNKALRR